MEEIKVSKKETCACGNARCGWDIDAMAFPCPICGKLICKDCSMYFTMEIARKKTPDGKLDKYPFGLPVPYERPQELIDNLNSRGWDLFSAAYHNGLHICGECGRNGDVVIRKFYEDLKKHMRYDE